MTNKRAYELDSEVEANRRDYYIPIDKTDLTEAQKIQIGDLLKITAISQQGNEAEDIAVTPKCLTETQATTSQKSTILTSTDALAIAMESEEVALVPKNLAAIKPDWFKQTKIYSDSDFDDSNSNYTSISITSLMSEMLVGNYIYFSGQVEVEIPAIDNIEIVINDAQLPIYPRDIHISRITGGNNEFRVSHCGTILISGGKLKLIISDANGSAFPAGTYRFGFNFNYLTN